MPRHRDEDTGQYKEVYTEKNILELLRDTRLSTTEVADALGCHRTTAHQRLVEMEEAGLIRSKQVGNTRIWELENN